MLLKKCTFGNGRKGDREMNKKERMHKQIEEHGANLNSIFKTGLDNITLCKKLHSLELAE